MLIFPRSQFGCQLSHRCNSRHFVGPLVHVVCRFQPVVKQVAMLEEVFRAETSQ